MTPEPLPSFGWHLPVTVRFGSGCSREAWHTEAHRPVLVMAFEPAEALGLREGWQRALGDRLQDWVTVPDGLSTLALAAELAPRVWRALLRAPGCVLVGLGGGSTMDIAKLLRARPIEGGFAAVAAVLRGETGWPMLAPAPLWLVPTTAGTGSEVTRWATLWDIDAAPPVKRSFDEPWGYATRAFVDPLLTHSCPMALTRDSALDALSHALEVLWNRHSQPLSRALAIQAAHRVLDGLPQVLAEPANAAAREALALAALEAGIAFSQTRTALAHALSYELTLHQGVPHGLACAVWLPTAWRLALGHDRAVDDSLARIFCCPADEGAGRLETWLLEVGAVIEPRQLGVHDAAARVRAALGSARGRNFVGAAAPAAA